MNLGLSKVTTQNPAVSHMKQSLPVFSSRNDPQSLVLRVVQNVVDALILGKSES